MPFLGLSIISIFLVTDIESDISQMWHSVVYLGWALLLGPRPAYIHLSWAPRWRICVAWKKVWTRLGSLPSPEPEDIMEGSDEDMEVVIDSIEDDSPVLYKSDSEE